MRSTTARHVSGASSHKSRNRATRAPANRRPMPSGRRGRSCADSAAVTTVSLTTYLPSGPVVLRSMTSADLVAFHSLPVDLHAQAWPLRDEDPAAHDLRLAGHDV